MDWGCVLYTGAYYIRDFTVVTKCDCSKFKQTSLSSIRLICTDYQ